jgi:chromosome segregation ATPase
MQTIWSAVRRWVSGFTGNLLEGSLPEGSNLSGGGSEKGLHSKKGLQSETGLRERLKGRVEAEKRKVSQLEAIEKRVRGLESAIGSLREAIRRFHKRLSKATEKQERIRKIQSEIAGGLEETQKGVKRLSKTILEHESDLVEIEDLKKQHREAAKTRRKTLLLGAAVGGLIGALISEIPIVWVMSSLWERIQSLLSFLA